MLGDDDRVHSRMGMREAGIKFLPASAILCYFKFPLNGTLSYLNSMQFN